MMSFDRNKKSLYREHLDLSRYGLAISLGCFMMMQVGFKEMMFMQLHAEAILDLFERPNKEIQFRAVAGDFRVLQGKFLLSEPETEVCDSR